MPQIVAALSARSACWWGRPLEVLPERGFRFDVRPNDESEAVERARTRREQMALAMERMPQWLGCPKGAAEALSQEAAAAAPPAEVIARMVVGQAVARVVSTWGTLAALEAVAADYAEWMDGNDLLHPDVRAMLDGLKEQVLEQRESLLRYIPAFDLPEADPEVVARMEQEIELAAE